MIKIDEKQVNRAYTLLSGIKDGRGPTIALQNAVNRAAITARSESAKGITDTYHIRQRDIKAETKIKNYRANQSLIEAGFEYAGYVIPLIKFQVNPPKPVSGRKRYYTRASVMKTTGTKTLRDAYVANLGLYGDGVFRRKTKERDSSQQLYGPSVAHMAENADVFARVETKAKETFDNCLEHEISRLLAGYGG